MRKLTSFFINEILYRKVYDEFDDCIGKLYDIYVTTENGYPKAIGYKIRRDKEMYYYEFRNIDFYRENSKIVIKVRGVKEIIPMKYSYLLSKHLLNKKIVDVNGKKVIKVNDLRMAKICGELRILAVDSGILAVARKYYVENIVKCIFKLFNKKPVDDIVLWESVQSLEVDNASLKLTVPYEKLSKLHPADLADILEELDEDYRNRILEYLDSDFAAEILEEINSELQVEILKSLKEQKAIEILEHMPNDEIADILDEASYEETEMLLSNLKKDDEEEVRTLLEYEDNVVGSIMNKDFICFNINITVQEVIELLREMKPDDEVSYYVYVVDEDYKLKGLISLRDLVVSSPESKINDIMVKEIISIKDCDDISEAVELIIKYDLTALPVVNDEVKLCGIVIINDILDEIISPHLKKKLKI